MNEIIESVAMKICEVECDHVGITNHESTYHRGMNRDVYTDCAKAAVYAYLTKLIEKAKSELKDSSAFLSQADTYNNGIINHKIGWLKAEQKLLKEG